MRKTRTGLCLLVAVAVLPGQWLESTLRLPDTLGGLRSLRCIACNTANNRMYVSGQEGECTIAIDGATSKKVARIPSGYFTIDACYNPVANKVYTANYYDDRLTVIDGAGDTVLATVMVGDRPVALCYDSGSNKVYCTNSLSDNVTVISCSTNAVVRTLSVGYGPLVLAWNPDKRRVYTANNSGSSVSVLRDSGGVALEEGVPPPASRRPLLATIIRGVLVLPASDVKRKAAGVLLDVSGRTVAQLKSGPNDLSRIASGVYYVKASGRETIARVVVQR